MNTEFMEYKADQARADSGPHVVLTLMYRGHTVEFREFPVGFGQYRATGCEVLADGDLQELDILTRPYLPGERVVVVSAAAAMAMLKIEQRDRGKAAS